MQYLRLGPNEGKQPGLPLRIWVLHLVDCVTPHEALNSELLWHGRELSPTPTKSFLNPQGLIPRPVRCNS